MCGWSKMRSGDRLCILISTLPPPWGLFHLCLSHGDIWRFPCLCHHWIFSRLGAGQRVYSCAAATWLVMKSRAAHWRHFLSPSVAFQAHQPPPPYDLLFQPVPSQAPSGCWPQSSCIQPPHLALPSSQSSHYCPKLSSCAAFMKLPLLSPFLSKWLDKWNLKRQHWRLFLGGRKWKSWLKSWSHHFIANRWGNSSRVSIFGFQNDCRWWLLLLRCFGCVWLCNPIDGSPPGSPIPGILQGVGAISFSRWWLQPWN